MKLSDVYSCVLTTRFGWSTSDIAGRWSPPAETYKLRSSDLARANNVEQLYPFKVVDTRVRVRGSGKVFLMHYESTPGKDFELIGRVTPFTAETES